MGAIGIVAAILAMAAAGCWAQKQSLEDPVTLVREVVYNELHDHDRHGYWRYWVEQKSPADIRIEEQVETTDGPVTRAVLRNGHPLDSQAALQEDARLRELASSPGERASLRQAYYEDEQRVGRILAMLPDAFLFQDAGEKDGVRHLRYAPNPNYPAHSIQARLFRELSGDLWIDARMKRMRKLEGHLNDNINVGFGLLGQVRKGSWFLMERTPVGPGDWKTDRLEIHMSGRAILFKTLARDTSEVRGGFEPVPARMSLEQGLRVLEQTVASRLAEEEFSPVAMVKSRD